MCFQEKLYQKLVYGLRAHPDAPVALLAILCHRAPFKTV